MDGQVHSIPKSASMSLARVSRRSSVLSPHPPGGARSAAQSSVSVTSPTPAASGRSCCAGGDLALEVLLVKRPEQARFMGGLWVFPGGAVDDDGEADHRGAPCASWRRRRCRARRTGRADEFSRAGSPPRSDSASTPLLSGRAARRARTRGRRRGVHQQGWPPPRRAPTPRARGRSCSSSPRSSTWSSCSVRQEWPSCLRYAMAARFCPVQPKVWFDGEVARVAAAGEPGSAVCSRSEGVGQPVETSTCRAASEDRARRRPGTRRLRRAPHPRVVS